MNQSHGGPIASLRCVSTYTSFFMTTTIALWIIMLLAAVLNILFFYILKNNRSFDANVRICLQTMAIGNLLSMPSKIVSIPYDIIALTTNGDDVAPALSIPCAAIQYANFVGYQISIVSFAVLVVERLYCSAKRTNNETNKPNKEVTQALAVVCFLSFLWPIANILRLISDNTNVDVICYCFMSQLNSRSLIVYTCILTICESFILLLFLIAHHLTKRNMLEIEKHSSVQQTSLTPHFSAQTILVTCRMLLFCEVLQTSAAWLTLLAVVATTTAQSGSHSAEQLLINLVLIVIGISYCGTPIIAIAVNKQLRTTAQQSVGNLLKKCAQVKTSTANEDNGRGATTGLAVESESMRSSSARQKSLVPAAPTTGPRRSSALQSKEDTLRAAHHRVGLVGLLPALPTLPRSSIQSDSEAREANQFWQQTAKWGNRSGLDFGWGSTNDGKIHQRRESVLVLPRIEPKPTVRREVHMPSID